MKAYTQGITKTEFVQEMRAHKAADDFIRGKYDGPGMTGCSVGCALKSVAKIKNIKLSFNNHAEFENHLGVPEWLARLNNTLFENVSAERMKTWPVEFAEAINEGADLEKIKPKFLIVVLQSSIDSMSSVQFEETKFPDVAKAIKQSTDAVFEMIRCHELGLSTEAARAAAAWAAWSAAWAAEAAAWAAAWAAWSAAWAAEAAAWAAWAAWSAESAAWSARSAAESAAESATFDYFADELLRLMRECK